MNNPFDIKTADGFDLSHGFLPNEDPTQQLPKSLDDWELAAAQLPKWLMSSDFRTLILDLSAFDIKALNTAADYERAMLILSYIGHAYVWCHGTPVDRLPAKIAQPWCAVADRIKRPPILSYASYALYNWRRIDKNEPIAIDNIVLSQNFLGGADEEWFILIHIDIEAKAIPALQAILPAIATAKKNDLRALTEQLEITAQSLTAMCNTLDRMPEYCDPYIYFNRVRPYIHGWKANPALPNGLVYEGVGNEQPTFLKGETGAQSTIVPSLDALLGIVHPDNPLKQHLEEMDQYMPPTHRDFLNHVRAHSVVRNVVLANKSNSTLKETYNQCVELIGRFRKTHIGYAAQYIQKQHQQTSSNPNAVGTGGTPFMKYLQSHLLETSEHLIL